MNNVHQSCNRAALLDSCLTHTSHQPHQLPGKRMTQIEEVSSQACADQYSAEFLTWTLQTYSVLSRHLSLSCTLICLTLPEYSALFPQLRLLCEALPGFPFLLLFNISSYLFYYISVCFSISPPLP